jgi:hypothetical protein
MQHPGKSLSKAPKKRAERLQLMLNSDEVDAVDNWRFEHRMPSRSAAVRALMNLGLHARVGHGSQCGGAMGQVSSADIGIIDTDPRVEEALGQPVSNAGVLVFASDAVTAHGLRAILVDAGIAVRRPVVEFDRTLRIARDEPLDALVLALRAREFPTEQIGAIVDAAPRVLLVCLDEARPEDLPEPLKGLPVLSRLSAPEALVQSVRDLFAANAA